MNFVVNSNCHFEEFFSGNKFFWSSFGIRFLTGRDNQQISGSIIFLSSRLRKYLLLSVDGVSRLRWDWHWAMGRGQSGRSDLCTSFFLCQGGQKLSDSSDLGARVRHHWL